MALSPMMLQYLRIKEEHKDAFLLFRVGDFYELYFEDAVKASEILDIYLTSRENGGERVPMAGVPFHSVDPYIAKLISAGHKVAICEQTVIKDLSTKKSGGGMFEREVVRIITPGTVVDSQLLNEEKNNYIASVFYDNETESVGISWSDISTGEFNHSKIVPPFAVALSELLTGISPAEIICNEAMLALSVSLSIVKYGMVCPFSLYDETAFCESEAQKYVVAQFGADAKKIFSDNRICVNSAGALLNYLNETQKRPLTHITKSASFTADGHMFLDFSARRNLELTENMHDFTKRGSLLGVIDNTKTKHGARKLRKLLLQPPLDENIINLRLDGVEELQNDRFRDKLSEKLKEIVDIERIVGKLSYGNIAPREILRLASSLSVIPAIKEILSTAKSRALNGICNKLTDYPEVYNEIMLAISDKAPQFVRDGGVFNDNYDAELDEFRNLQNNTAAFIANLEAAERAETKIKNLKISFTKGVGYYIEVPVSQAHLVPFRYIRRRTLKNCERFMTDELRHLEEKILNAANCAVLREEELYNSLTESLKNYIEPFLALSDTLAELDILVSNGITAKQNRFNKPVINSKVTGFNVIDGRHCVVEKLLKDEQFVPNDTLLDNDDNRIMLITGPNMAGKSVYMRQVGIIAILAHIGSFVPAKSATVPIIDKIFTRVGSGDDMLTGKSTFMLEMSEISAILSNMSDKSLLLLDEIGRGTATYDGLSIAWSILEHLSENTKAKVLFSTHYHELTELEGVLKGLKNYKMTLRETNGTIIFLRRLLRGQVNRSFGIEVAKLAGLPDTVVERAGELLKRLEAADVNRQAKMAGAHQLSMFSSAVMPQSEIQTILKELDLDSISPRLALDILIDLKEKADKKN